MTDSTGKTADQYAFDELGKEVAGGKQSPNATNVLHNTFGYAGEQWDSEAGLQYLRNRYYDPEVGRFINRDNVLGIMSNPISQNRYVYAWNNPVNLTDPSGQFPSLGGLFGAVSNVVSSVANVVSNAASNLVSNVVGGSLGPQQSYNPSTTSCNQVVEGTQDERIIKRYEQWVREHGYYGVNSSKVIKQRIIMPGALQLIYDHYFYRDELNKGVPNTLNEAKSKGWILMPPEESVFHQIDAESNVKYISPDGHKEAVYDSITGKLDTSPLNRGTYNRVAPIGLIGKLGHLIFDVLPYYPLGNTPDDMPALMSRIEATIKSFRIKLGI